MLILGGHSFIQQLGNDGRTGFEDQCGIVSACLDAGITTFDTTYQPERVALGKVLVELGRRDEAHIIAWNFFVGFGPGDDVGGPSAYRPEHIHQMLDELRTDHIDSLVVHDIGNADEDARQMDLAHKWLDEGLVGRLGTWAPSPENMHRFEDGSPVSFMVRPYNVLTPKAPAAFAAAKKAGLECIACSPFVRGWQLDKMVEAAGGESNRKRVADSMLRYSLYRPDVDRLIVAMRSTEYVAPNVASAAKEPLSPADKVWLLALVAHST